jgi:hypothetical protein
MELKRLTSIPVSRMRLVGAASLATAAFVMVLAPSLSSASSARFPHLKIMSAKQARQMARRDPNAGTLGPAARHALHRGYLVPNQARYNRQKARITRRAEARNALTRPVDGALAPTKIRQWAGINDVNSTPPDETSAVGTQRYIELVNSKFAIYNKTGNTPIGTGTLNALDGLSSTVNVFDPQIMWDGQTNRFFFANDIVISNTNNGIAFGWSKTATPTSAADFCKYAIATPNGTFYDYPKLGDSQFFAIIGANVFSNSGPTGSFVGSDLVTIKKPPAGATCPSGASLSIDNLATPLKATSSALAFTPVPASEIDTKATGWVVARTLATPSTHEAVFKVTKNASGNPVFQNPGAQVTVPSYTIPPSIPQNGSTHKIDSSDARNTQAQAGVDPGHSNKFALWTQHTVKGGAGAEVRWYEINPGAHSLLQQGKATSPSLYEFNGAIAPNRLVQGNTQSGGRAMVMNFNTSSSATFPSIKMVSKVGSASQSGQVSVFNGTKPLGGFDCSVDPCRWGDYAAATPDPSTQGRIWNVSQYGVGSASTTGPATSRTWHFIAAP